MRWGKAIYDYMRKVWTMGYNAERVRVLSLTGPEVETIIKAAISDGRIFPAGNEPLPDEHTTFLRMHVDFTTNRLDIVVTDERYGEVRHGNVIPRLYLVVLEGDLVGPPDEEERIDILDANNGYEALKAVEQQKRLGPIPKTE